VNVHPAEMTELATRLWGEPSQQLSTRDELRFGRHGSKAVRPKDGKWYDHELEEGGGYADLYQRVHGHRPADATIVATYDYRDADGSLLYQVVRKAPKAFIQRRPDGAGGWTWSTKGVRRIPYRLPELLAAAASEPVFVVEGEKDVESLRDRLLIATCNAGGAGKWTPDLAEYLRGRRVVVLPDNDQAGEDHAQQVARSLHGLAAQVRVLRLEGLPAKGDVSDWLAAGGTGEQLTAIAQAAFADQSEVERPEDFAPLQRSDDAQALSPPEQADGPWPDPLDFLADTEATGAPELSRAHVPDAIADFVFDGAERMGVDPSAMALAALVALSSVISDDWTIQPKQHDDTWTENPRLWGAIVGDPSILKTPVLKATTRPIDAMEADARGRYASAVQRYKAALKDWKDGGSDPAAEPKHPRLERYMVEGTTIEALSEALRDDFEARQTAPARKVLVRQDEMSEWVASFDRYRSGGRGGGDRGAYLRLFNGGRYTIDRVNRGSFAVPNWSACVLGGIQPGPIQQIARDAADDGLLQRFCYCVPAQQGRGQDRRPDAGAAKRFEALFPALAALHPSQAFTGTPRPVVLHAAAHAHRLAILDLAEAVTSMPDTSGRLRAALGKWPGLFARLALIFHLIDVADVRMSQMSQGGAARAVTTAPPALEVVPETTARRVASYMRDILLPHLLRAEAVMFASEQTGHARWIAGYILSKGEDRITSRDIVRAYGALRAPEQRRELLSVMESLETVGWVIAEERDPTVKSPTSWRVNPKVHGTFAVRAQREREVRADAKRRIAATVQRLRNGSAA